ncbi:MAG: hypothetical protein JST04_04030 [Bdellovibrionales bacterium]|nr:hypothetical protein [Bdellovibrionales bacterium]
MKVEHSRASTAFTRLASRSVCGLLAVAIALPISPTAFADDSGLANINATNISSGDTASALPDVKKICDAVQSSQQGTFATQSGVFMGTASECAGLTRRERQTQACQVDLGASLAGLSGQQLQDQIDSLCSQSAGLSHDAAVYCALRNATKGGQALQYCNAYMSADKAQDGLKKTLFFDIAAAGACFTDYIAIKMAQKSGGTYKGVACGGAAMAASMMELVQTVSILGKTKDAYGDGSSGDHSAGGYKIDSSNRVVDRGGLAKALEITASTTLSASAMMIGVCYYNKSKNGLCGQFSSIKGGQSNYGRIAKGRATDRANNAYKQNYQNARSRISGSNIQDSKTEDGGEKVTWQEDDQIEHDYNSKIVDEKNSRDDAITKDYKEKVTRISEQDANAALAMRAALIFTALAGMRGLASSTAGKTKKDAEDILQSLFTSNGGTTSFGGSGMGGFQASTYTSTNVSSFNSTTGDGSTKSASTAAAADPSDSAFLAPPGSALNQKAGAIAAAMPASAKNGDMGTSAGLGAGIAAAATAAGVPASALGEIRSHVDSVFANLPKEGGGYGGSSGGGLAKKSDGGGGMDGLNLKGLFGGGEKEEKAAGNESLAYRGLASDDIWHSRNPKGNNLFQIISDRYDTAQRRQEMAP